MVTKMVSFGGGHAEFKDLQVSLTQERDQGESCCLSNSH